MNVGKINWQEVKDANTMHTGTHHSEEDGTDAHQSFLWGVRRHVHAPHNNLVHP